MLVWLVRRTAAAAITACVAIVILVLLLHALPGDPIAALTADHPTDPATVAQLRHTWGVDRTPWQSLSLLAHGVARGDLGMSLSQQRPVLEVLRDRIGPTLLLGSLTLLVDFTVGLVLGLWSALHPRRWRARIIGALAVIGYALPSFVVGMALVWLFAVQWHLLPAAGMSDVLLSADASSWQIFADRVQHLALPLLTLVIATLAIPLRQQRAAALTTVNQPWVLAARARGVSPARVAWRHCWRPALTPVITLFGLWLPFLVTGAVFVEVVFAWPGLGSLIAEATSSRDAPMVIACGALIVVVVQVGSLSADLLYRVVDPVQRSA